jgi:SAM-dependent methyltransferase
VLPALYRDPQRYDLIASLRSPGDLPFYRRQLERFGAPLLELGCGTGRITLPLAAEGVAVCGIDNAAALLEHARAKADAADISLELRQADMRDFDLGRRFRLVLLPYNAINHLIELDDLCAMLRCAERHLEAEGRLVIDTFQPDPSFLANDGGGELPIAEYDDPHHGEHVVMTETNAYDAATQVNWITWHYQVNGEPNARSDRWAMRMFFPRELDALLALNGWVVEAKYGDYTESPFGSRSPKQLTVCRLP